MTIASEDAETVQVVELDEEHGRKLFEKNCRAELNVSAEEFLAAHDAGDYPERWDIKAIQSLEFLIPFARPEG